MAQGLRLELRQSQQLVMTPQLQQAIRLLQMSNIELSRQIEAESERNPLLEVEPPAPPVADAPAGAAAAEAAAADVASPDVVERAPGEDPGAAEQVFDTGRENLYEGAPSLASRPAPEDGLPDAGDLAAAGRTLAEILSEQIGRARAPARIAAVARCIAQALDPDGYLREPLSELAGRLGVEAPEAEAALCLVQGCEPTGVGARSLAECFALQLAERDRLDPMMARLLDNLELLARGDRRRVRTATGASEEDLADMLSELRRLDPRPAAGIASEPVAVRVPDVLLRRVAGGGWDIELNPETLPRVAIDRHYAARLSAGGAEVDRWISERRAEAAWLIRSIEKRAGTILSVSAEIVRRQERFFEIGAAGLRPLTLRQVAETTGLHESTVSRVTSNKHIACERGIFELKFFFSNAIGTGDDLSAEAVRQRLKALIDAEPADAVLSDDALVEILRAEGMDIARRTVAKYRKTLRIPSSVDRRRQKALA